jgi:hypothetical protein
MDNYYFVYLDTTGRWHSASNPVFIATHTYCRAIPKDILEQAGYDLIADFCHELNDPSYGSSTLVKIKSDWNIY